MCLGKILGNKLKFEHAYNNVDNMDGNVKSYTLDRILGPMMIERKVKHISIDKKVYWKTNVYN